MRPEEFTIRFGHIDRLEPGGLAHMAQRERLCLYSLVYGLAPRYALELGSYTGGSAMIISGALDDVALGGKLMAVEPNGHMIDPRARAAIAHNGVFVEGFFPEDLPRTFDGQSTEGLFEFCFYDALHDEEFVARTLALVPRFLAPGGFIVSHDSYYAPQARGIERAVKKAGLIDCGMITRVANDVAEPGALYGGMRLMKKPGELPYNS